MSDLNKELADARAEIRRLKRAEASWQDEILTQDRLLCEFDLKTRALIHALEGGTPWGGLADELKLLLKEFKPYRKDDDE